MSGPGGLDLVVLLPGKDERETVDALLGSRSESLGIRPVRYRLIVHPRRDPGCLNEAPEVLSGFAGRADHALVLFDHEGSGREGSPSDTLTRGLTEELESAGWAGRAGVVVFQPELESWVWGPSPAVDEAIGWARREPGLRTWLSQRGFLPGAGGKPARPKEAIEAALREVRIPRSSAIYRRIAETAGLRRCQDPSFLRFREILTGWFGR